MSIAGLGAFAGGMAKGIQEGSELVNRRDANKRAQAEADRKAAEYDKENKLWSDIVEQAKMHGGSQPASNANATAAAPATPDAQPGLGAAAPQDAPNSANVQLAPYVDVGRGMQSASLGQAAGQAGPPIDKNGELVSAPPIPSAQPGLGAMQPAASQPMATTDQSPNAAPTPQPGLAPAPADATAPPTADAGIGTAQPKASDGPKTPLDQVRYELFKNPSLFANRDFLNAATEIFMKAGKPQYIDWLTKNYNAAQENIHPALRALIAGDIPGAVADFNARGIQVSPDNIHDAGNGNWNVKFDNGQTMSFNAQQELRSLLDPKAAVSASQKDQDMALKRKELDDKSSEAGKKLDLDTQRTAAYVDAQRAIADLRNRSPGIGSARASRGGAGSNSKQQQYAQYRIDTLVASGTPLDQAQRIVAGGASVVPSPAVVAKLATSMMKQKDEGGLDPLYKTINEATSAAKKVLGLPTDDPAPKGGAETNRGGTGLSAVRPIARTPAELPAGSKQIGTKNGKPMWQSPDGRRFVPTGG